MHGDERNVTIDAETATETVTRSEEIDRIRRESGIEQGALPHRDLASGGEAEGAVGRSDDRDPARQSGVPPQSNDDIDDPVDHASADSFPASDPPGTY